ncbi:MAG: HVO_0476 family zinc finger protein [Methanosarcinaceae archaeon]|nr:HVO_0476 family zinc finger protein [Methanosarcinaceae archaeon]MDD4331476.1 HVO_0476 family zinc finger protein [Methanosarcinaceae archaeon]MDD4748637.1 HVO_0476 family zinc finger protein [Methanosarcinaceae archaeon]
MKEEIEVECPSCSPEEEVPHEVLKSGQNPVVRCLECGQVHATSLKSPKILKVNVVISKGEESFSCKTELEAEEVLYVDDELVVDDEAADIVCPILITSLEVGEKRPDFAKAEELDTIWARAIDEITIKFSVQSGTEKTEVMEKKVPGDYEFVVGAEEKIGKEKVTLTKIKIRDGGFLSRKGAGTAAKHVKRIFAKKKRRRAWGSDFRKGPW